MPGLRLPWWGKDYQSRELAFLRPLRVCLGGIPGPPQGADPVTDPPRIRLVLPAPVPEPEPNPRRDRAQRNGDS